ncbi:methionine--tRNA ligase [Thermocladium modestius]|uniref:methionine--tRNA ligase n=2 Tax=Thermocladium modestius TaxID=62609 RepID=A0A830GSI0_9CREN|nr:methionine--tRNA ligase [Thermocladium modestius]
MIGSVLSADVFARYLRLRGDDVLFVSGSDEHGTPIEVEAMKQGVEPRKLTDEMHATIKNLFKEWEISFDNYTRTESDVHKEFVRGFFLKIYENGYVFTKDEEVPYCPRDKIYLPDRFIIGTCPYCGYDKARGDQCENCGRLLEPRLLLEPKCAICGAKPEWRSTTHWYLDLRKLEDDVRRYVEGNNNLSPNAKQMSLAMLKEGLRPRAITRDNKWGIPAPFPGAEGKTIYVWFEAVLGYVSAVIEYFNGSDEWRRYWMNQDTRVVFFIGKDNIPFHVILLPALLMATREPYVMPWSTSSTEYLLYEGMKFSKSQGVGIWIDEAIKLLPADYWRFFLIMTRPENRDSNFSWSQFAEVINSTLNDTVGNFIHRVLTLIAKREVNDGEAREEEVREAMKAFEASARHYENIELKDALLSAVEIARIGNKYLNEVQPWKLEQTDASIALANAVVMVKALGVSLYPVMPAKMGELWAMLGMDASKIKWSSAYESIGIIKASNVHPLFRKLSNDDVKSLINRLGEMRGQGRESA